jgi:DNA-binding CsgD family transcriptional regulator
MARETSLRWSWRWNTSEATVKSHLAHIYTMLEVDTRAGAVARAIELRIIRPPS